MHRNQRIAPPRGIGALILSAVLLFSACGTSTPGASQTTGTGASAPTSTGAA